MLPRCLGKWAGAGSTSAVRMQAPRGTAPGPSFQDAAEHKLALRIWQRGCGDGGGSGLARFRAFLSAKNDASPARPGSLNRPSNVISGACGARGRCARERTAQTSISDLSAAALRLHLRPRGRGEPEGSQGCYPFLVASFVCVQRWMCAFAQRLKERSVWLSGCAHGACNRRWPWTDLRHWPAEVSRNRQFTNSRGESPSPPCPARLCR